MEEDDDNEEKIQNNDNNSYENEEEHIIIENDEENENDDMQYEEQQNEENNLEEIDNGENREEEMINEENNEEEMINEENNEEEMINEGGDEEEMIGEENNEEEMINEGGDEEEMINEENNEEEMINEENNEEIENNDLNNNNNDNTDEKELYNNKNEEEFEESDNNYNFPSTINNQNNNIKIEEYESEVIENNMEKSLENNDAKNEDYILNKLARIKKNNKIKLKNKNNIADNNISNNIEDKILKNNKKNYNKLIYITPIVNSCRIQRKEKGNILQVNQQIPENIKFGINEEGNPINIYENDKNKIIAYIVPKSEGKEKNYLIDINGNIIPKTEEGDYIYTQKSGKDKFTKSILIKDFDVQNPELRVNTHTIKDSINSQRIYINKNNTKNHLKKNIYNKSNDDIKRILNLNNRKNNTLENLLNYDNLMDVWRQRYGKRRKLYKELNPEFDFSFKKDNNEKMIKRTNSILKKNENHYISSFTDGNIDIYKSKNILGKKYNSHIYYNGIVNRIYPNPLIKRNVMMIHDKIRYNPLLKYKNNQSIQLKRHNNFTDILRARLNHSDYSYDFNRSVNNKSLSFGSLNFIGQNNENKLLYMNKRYNYSNTNNILKNSLYAKILQKNKEKENKKSNYLNNNNKQYSIINNSIYNIIKDINNKKQEKVKYSILSMKANQLIKKFNENSNNKKNILFNNK